MFRQERLSVEFERIVEGQDMLDYFSIVSIYPSKTKRESERSSVREKHLPHRLCLEARVH